MNNDGRLVKRHRDEQEQEVENRSVGSSTTDRLTHLPKPILYHILSFLDTKSAVQTSVLSLDWNRAWKHVPVLNFDRTSFHPAAKFDKFVSKVLSLRYDLKLRKVVYLSNDGRGKASRALQVVGYALSHNVEELTLDSINNHCRDFSIIFSDYCDDNEKKKTKRNDDLKTLNLSCFKLERGFAACSGFPMLTTLILRRCYLDSLDLVLSDNNFPCLRNLHMDSCYPNRALGNRIKVHGPRLRNLKLGSSICLIEIYAPELKVFTLCKESMISTRFCSSPLPALECADIELTLNPSDKKMAGHYLSSLFRCVQSAKTLTLRGSTIETLNSVFELLEHPSPFQRLECLILSTNKLLDKVVDYFFGESSCEKYVKLVNG